MEILLLVALALLTLIIGVSKKTQRRRQSPKTRKVVPKTHKIARQPRPVPKPTTDKTHAREVLENQTRLDNRQLLHKGILQGKAHVIDGDTISIRWINIRLAGIDAPELDQPYGQKAKWAMVDICRGQYLSVELTGEVSYKRLVGIVRLPDGTDAGAELIKRGLAIDFGYFSGGKYRHLETQTEHQYLRNARYRRN